MHRIEGESIGGINRGLYRAISIFLFCLLMASSAANCQQYIEPVSEKYRDRPTERPPCISISIIEHFLANDKTSVKVQAGDQIKLDWKLTNSDGYDQKLFLLEAMPYSEELPPDGESIKTPNRTTIYILTTLQKDIYNNRYDNIRIGSVAEVAVHVVE